MKVPVVGDAGYTAGRASQPGSRLGLTVSIAAMIGSLLPSYIQALSVVNGRKTVRSIGGRGTRNRIVFTGLLALRSAADEPVFKGTCS